MLDGWGSISIDEGFMMRMERMDESVVIKYGVEREER